MAIEGRYDVIVAGGGVAGIAAAVSSARLGARTLLVERYGFLGGLGTAGLVNPFMSSCTSTGKPLVGGCFAEICERMGGTGGMLGRAFDPEAMKFHAQEMVLEAGSGLLLHSWVVGARMAGSSIVGVEVLTKSGSREVEANVVVDATGDADIAAMACAPYELGSPEDGMTQAMTLMFTVGGVYIGKALAYAKQNPDQMRFPKPASDADIERMLEGAVGIAGFYKEVEEARSKGEFPLPQDMVFFISLPTPGQVVVNTTHIGGVDGTSSEDLTRAEVEGRRQVMVLMKFFRKYIPGFEAASLLQTATQVGVRETRRVMGEYVFSAEDIEAGKKFPDAVLRSAYPVDIHPPVGKGYSREDDGKSPATPPRGDWYEVPYRCLVPLDVDNILVAGRCISATHEGQSALRIMPNCMALGQAAGAAAALCAEKGMSPRSLDTVLLRRHLLAQGAII
ncbi:MAG TPA: FAD-dependent oxidoreductase [Armatimonadota bacterium]|nr:FAD-dependent oxidoreductase [Armatimonadota bacterium]